jgi:hypothetical protein
MNEEKFTTLALNVNYVGVKPVSVIRDDEFENKMLLYFSKEIDSAEVPLCITEIQAQQLYEDLEKIFQKSE